MSKTFESLLSVVEGRFYKSDFNIEKSSNKPTFFYHVKKTGGMSFFYSFLSKTEHNKKVPTLARVYTHKYDRREDIDIVLSYPMTNNTLIMSHLNYGAHSDFHNDFNLVTVLREPFKRALSNYTYQCMRAQKLPSVKGFRAFMNTPEHINVMCKQLKPNHYKLCPIEIFQHLRDNFTYYGTTQDIPLFIEHYISTFKLPNVLMAPMNQTLPQYKLDARECLSEFYDLNAEDVELFQLVQSAPRLPEKAEGVESVSNFTAIQYERESEKQSICRSHTVPTQTLFNYLNRIDQQFKGTAKVNLKEMFS